MVTGRQWLGTACLCGCMGQQGAAGSGFERWLQALDTMLVPAASRSHDHFGHENWDQIDTYELSGGARINRIFHERFPFELVKVGRAPRGQEDSGLPTHLLRTLPCTPLLTPLEALLP